MTIPSLFIKKKYYSNPRCSSTTAVLSVVFCAFLFLSRSDTIARGIGEGLFVCTNIILPSLFCFMILTNFVIFSGLNKVISPILSPVTRGLFHLEPNLGCIILMSMIGGYPIGASAIAAMIKEGSISSKTAQRMMCFCCCAAPSFVITAVGAGMFSNSQTGVILYAVQVISSIILGIFVCFRANSTNSKNLSHSAISSTTPFGEAFVNSVNSAVIVMAQMFGYILLFSAVLALLKESMSGPAGSIIPGFLEVTTGCKSASELSGVLGICATSFFLSFGGASVLCQIAGILKGSGVSMKVVILFRVFHGILAFVITYAYTQFCPDVLPTFSGSGISSAGSVVVPVISHNTPILTSCLLVMCGMMLMASSQTGDFSK